MHSSVHDEISYRGVFCPIGFSLGMVSWVGALNGTGLALPDKSL